MKACAECGEPVDTNGSHWWEHDRVFHWDCKPRCAVQSVRLHLNPGELAAHVLPAVKTAAEVNPGEHVLVLVTGERALELGPQWRVDASVELVAELEEYGRVEVIEGA